MSNLDAKLRVQMRTEISKLHKKLKATIVYVTHDQVEAMTMGDKIAVMDKGIVQQFDSPLNLYNAPVNKFVAGFLGNPAMNFIEGKIINEGALKFIDKSNSLTVAPGEKYKSLPGYSNKEIILGVRPEDILFGAQTDSTVKEFETNIEVTEMLGNELFIYFNIGEKQCVARTPVDTNLLAGVKAKLRFNHNKLYFFDPVTGMSIQE